MLTAEKATTIGINACVDSIGRDFFKAHRDNSVSSRGEWDGVLYCYVGVGDKPYTPSGKLAIDSISHFPYYASCNVSLDDGSVEMLQCVAAHSWMMS